MEGVVSGPEFCVCTLFPAGAFGEGSGAYAVIRSRGICM